MIPPPATANSLKRNNPPCPIHSASLCGMDGKPGTSDFPDPFHPLGVDEAGERRKRNNPPCPIHSASLCGMGGKPGTSDFPDPFHPFAVDEAGERLTCQHAPHRGRANSL